jgi:4-phytase / acid phosphatase
MPIRNTLHFLLITLCAGLPVSTALAAQGSGAPAASGQAQLEFVVMLSRHGVRSPLGTPGELDKYSAAPWPQWDVAPGILSAHGYELMKLFGAWDRTKFSAAGLLAPAGCADAAHVTILADTDERTRETGKALAEGMLPGCTVAVHAQAGGNDPLFRPMEAGVGETGAGKAGVGHAEMALSVAAISGRIGGDAGNLTEAYRPQLAALDHVLAGCGHVPTTNAARVSIFDIPSGLGAGNSDRPASLRGPAMTGATMAEDLLLEYTNGMSDENTGWGCLDGPTLRFLMQLDTAGWEYGTHTPAIARPKASNLLDHIEKSMQQRIAGKPVAGALGKPGDRLLLLVGHDTNIATVAGALGIDWIIDGRVDDTPPGGALLFELWRSAGGEPFVRLEYTAQTIDQMRRAEALTPANPPGQEPIFVPGCSRKDMSCTWDGFAAAMQRAIDPAYVNAQP